MSALAAASSGIWAAQWGTGSQHVPALAGVLGVGILLPLLIVLPAYWRGRVRRRLGKPPGWSGPGWTLPHVWLAFAFLIAAEIVVFYALQPDVFHRLVLGRHLSPIEIPPAMPALGSQLLWTTLAVSSCLLVVIPLAPMRLLWTTRWTPAQCLIVAVVAFIALRVVAIVLAPAVPELTSS